MYRKFIVYARIRCMALRKKKSWGRGFFQTNWNFPALYQNGCGANVVKTSNDNIELFRAKHD